VYNFMLSSILGHVAIADTMRRWGHWWIHLEICEGSTRGAARLYQSPAVPCWMLHLLRASFHVHYEHSAMLRGRNALMSSEVRGTIRTLRANFGSRLKDKFCRHESKFSWGLSWFRRCNRTCKRENVAGCKSVHYLRKWCNLKNNW
jgi:hypothetical protein